MTDPDVLYLSELLDVPVPRLYMLSNRRRARTPKKRLSYANYYTVTLRSSKSGKERVLSVPNSYLKAVQRRVLNSLLYKLPVSPYATAYQPGMSLVQNAAPHAGHACILKLDISHFFDSIDPDMVYPVMRELGLSVPASVLLTNLCTCNGKLPQGAPTSPCIANLVMRRFDAQTGAWCEARSITYTRYCDDMTFSGTAGAIRESGLLRHVRQSLSRMGFALNQDKTLLVRSAQQQRVTGIVVNEKPALSRQERRRIRQEVYYCQKFGVLESLNYRSDPREPAVYLRALLGRISYAMQIDPEQPGMRACFTAVQKMLKQENT